MLTRDNFRDHIVAQHDDEDWQESGYVITLVDGVFSLFHYSHCSCYGTVSVIMDGNIGTPLWTGDKDAMIELASGRGDPIVAGRTISEDDCDYGHLVVVYAQILQKYGPVVRGA